MNKVLLLGNLTKDVEYKQTPNGVAVATFTLAVRRRIKNAQGGYDADFINCVAWRHTADFLRKYFGKGQTVAVVGQIQTRNYEDNNGNKRYVTEVLVDEAEFAGGKAEKANKPEDDVARYTPEDLFGDEIGAFSVNEAELPF